MRRLVAATGAAILAIASPALAQSAEDVVASQVEAYQARDMERFLSHYADDAVVEALGMTFRGKEQIRQAYAMNFQPGTPTAQVVERRVEGNYVQDRESYKAGDQTMCCSYTTYEVEGGLIRRVWVEN